MSCENVNENKIIIYVIMVQLYDICLYILKVYNLFNEEEE